MHREFWLTLLLAGIFLDASAPSQEKKKDKKIEPRMIVALPLGVKPGVTQNLTLRGLSLDTTSEVTFPDGVQGKIVSKGKAGVPDKNPEKVGDTQIVVELKISDRVKKNFDLSLATPDGVTKPHTILVESELPLIKETEPSDGFRKPMEVKLPVVIDGAIERPRDIDVFAFSGKKGQKLVANVLANRHGSPLDGQLVLYRGNAIQVAANEDTEKVDPRIEIVLPEDDRYFLVLTDAHDMGSAIHAYRLRIE